MKPIYFLGQCRNCNAKLKNRYAVHVASSVGGRQYVGVMKAAVLVRWCNDRFRRNIHCLSCGFVTPYWKKRERLFPNPVTEKEFIEQLNLTKAVQCLSRFFGMDSSWWCLSSPKKKDTR